MFSALETQVPQQAKKVWCIPKGLFSREKEGEYIYTKGLQGVCGGTLRAILVYRFWPPIIRVVMGLKWYSTTRSSIPSLLKGTWKRTPQPIFQPKSSFAPLPMVRATRPILAPCGFGNVCLLLRLTWRRRMWDGFGFLPKVQVCAIWGFHVGDVHVQSSWWQPGNFQPEPCSVWSLRAIRIFGSVTLLGTRSQPQMDTRHLVDLHLQPFVWTLLLMGGLLSRILWRSPDLAREIVLGSFSDPVPILPPLGGIVFGSFSDYFRLVFGSSSDRLRIVFGSFSDPDPGNIWQGSSKDLKSPVQGSQKDPKPHLRKDRPESPWNDPEEIPNRSQKDPQPTRAGMQTGSQQDPKPHVHGSPHDPKPHWIPKWSQTTHVQGTQQDLTFFSFSAVESKEHQYLLESAEELSRLYFREHMAPSFTAMFFTWENGKHKRCSSRALYACLSSRAKRWQVTLVTDPSFWVAGYVEFGILPTPSNPLSHFSVSIRP